MVVDLSDAYYSTDTQIIKIQRNNQVVQWTASYSYPYALIETYDMIFAGGDGEIAAFDCATGTRVWTASVDGKAHGLAVANGRLYVSTDQGSIYCFSEVQ